MVNEFMASFLDMASEKISKKAHGALVALWESEENQVKLKKTFKGKAKKGKAKGKKKKDPNKPKRARSAYIYFGMDKRDEVKEDNPDMNNREIMSELGKLWSEIKGTTKVKKYVKQAAKDKKRYNAEMKEYVPSSDDEPGEKKRKRKSSSGKKSKRAKSAYIYFTMDMRSEVKEDNPDMSPREIMSELGRIWREDFKGTSNAKKYETLSAKDKKRVQAEKELVVSDNDGEVDIEEKKESKTKKPKSKKVKKSPKTVKKSPKKKNVKKSPKKTVKKNFGYELWAKKNRSDLSKASGLKGAKLTKQLLITWKSLDDEDKEEWIDAADAEAIAEQE